MGDKMNTMTTTYRLTRIEQLVTLIEEDTKQRLQADGMAIAIFTNHYEIKVKVGNKYTKIDRGTSGYLMIDAEGRIFGIKAYGVIHRGHQYGTLETISNYNWGGYAPVLKGV